MDREAELAFGRLSQALVELAGAQAMVEGELEQALAAITEAAARALPVARVSVWLYNDTRSAILCHDLYEQREGRHSQGQALEAGRFPAYFRALAEQRVISADDAHHDPRTSEFSQSYLAPLGIVAMLDAPIRVRGKMIGVVCHEHIGDSRHWTTQDRAFAGSVADFAAMAFDARQRRALEEQLRQAQKMEAIGLLAGGVSHDFNNLLTVIIGHTEMAIELSAEDDPKRNSLEEIRRAAECASSLTRQLLAFSRRQALQPRVLDLNRLALDMSAMLQRMIGERVLLSAKLAANLWSVCADNGQLEQVLMNLAVNARDAMPQGGQLTIETLNATLSETLAAELALPPGDYVQISVTDTGVGMDEETRARIFEPFFTTKRATTGTGLGLSTVYGIVKQSGGAVAVASEVGKGSAFNVYLPRATGEQQRAADQAKITLPRRTGETLLLIEDDARVGALLRDVLRGQGYVVLHAGDGDEGIALARGHAGPIHLLVTDVVMPGLGGADVAASLRRERPELRVLFVSGYSFESLGEQGVLDPTIPFLQKPFVPAVLASKVREVLDGAR